MITARQANEAHLAALEILNQEKTTNMNKKIIKNRYNDTYIGGGNLTTVGIDLARVFQGQEAMDALEALRALGQDSTNWEVIEVVTVKPGDAKEIRFLIANLVGNLLQLGSRKGTFQDLADKLNQIAKMVDILIDEVNKAHPDAGPASALSGFGRDQVANAIEYVQTRLTWEAVEALAQLARMLNATETFLTNNQ